MSRPYDDELKTGLAAVRKATEICRIVQGSITPEVLEKKDNSPVTVADFASQAVICHAINERFPDDPVIAEEDGLALYQPENQCFLREIHSLIERCYQPATELDIRQWIDRGGAADYSDRFWTLDPIDGTKGFLRRDQFAISLALIVRGQIEIGILGCPNLGTKSHSGHTLFYAVRGHGAFSTRMESGAETQSLKVSTTTDPKLVRLCEPFETGHSLHGESAEIANRLGCEASPIRMDSQAKYAMVAGGDADVYLRLPTKTGYFEKIWDHAGGALIVEEAGGTVTDMCGKPLEFSHGRELRQNRGIIVTNGSLHREVLAATQSVFAARQS